MTKMDAWIRLTSKMTAIWNPHSRNETLLSSSHIPFSISGIAFFNDNDLTGVMPSEVCANLNNTSPPGSLGTF